MFSAQEIYILRKENQYLKSHHTRLKLAYLNQKGKVSQSEEESKRLRQENKKLKEEIKRINDELEKVRKQRDTYKGMIFKPKVVTIIQKDLSLKRKLGGQLGHIGSGRKVPVKVDQTVRASLKSCPHCSSPLKRSNTYEAHTIEDIPNFEQIRTQVTEYRLERQWCSSCHKEVLGKPAWVISHSRLGLNLIIQILIFKYVCRMSLEVLTETLFQSCRATSTQAHS